MNPLSQSLNPELIEKLKNKTGEILDQVLRGNTIQLLKHGRAIAEISPMVMKP